MGIANIGIVRAEGQRTTTVISTDLLLIQRIDSTSGQYSPRMITAQNLVGTVPFGSTRSGNATLASGTVTVANTSVTANSKVFLTRSGLNSSTGIGSLSVSINAGVGFTITSYNALAATETGDTSTVYWFIIET